MRKVGAEIGLQGVGRGVAEGPADDGLGNTLAQQGSRQLMPKEIRSLSMAKGLSDAGRAHDPRCDVAQTPAV